MKWFHLEQPISLIIFGCGIHALVVFFRAKVYSSHAALTTALTLPQSESSFLSPTIQRLFLIVVEICRKVHYDKHFL